MIISKTPLRLSFLGGNTDFKEYYQPYGGLVLTTTIDKYIYCIVSKRFDDEIRINYSIKEIVNSVDEIKHELVREALKKVGINKGVEITFLSDIPSEGSGLGSSSAVLVGLLKALYKYVGKDIDPYELARQACEIEIDVLKKPIGVQDQYIAALGGLRWIRFDDSVYSKKINYSSKLEKSLMLFYTGITRSSSAVLKHMDFKVNTKLLDYGKTLAFLGTECIEKGDIEELGKMLDEYWTAKKQINNCVTNSQIDHMYETAKVAGAWGGKIAGAGGGGFLMLLAAPEKHQQIRESLDGYKELPVKLEPNGSQIIFTAP